MELTAAQILAGLAPVLTVIMALLCKNVILALFFGIFYCAILLNGVNFLVPMADYILQGIQGNGFILVLFVMLGVSLRFMRIGGGFKAFENWANKKVASAEKAGLLVFLISLVIGVQDGLANILVGRIVKPVVDRQKMTPYKSAYITSSLAANIATPFPGGTYFLFCVAMAEAFFADQNPVVIFYKVCGLSVHTWLSIIICLLVVLKALPDLGEMKKQQALADQGVNVRQGSGDADLSALMGSDEEEGDWWPFLLATLGMVVFMVITSLIAGEIVVVPSAFLSAFATAIYVGIKKKMSFRQWGGEFCAGCLEQAGLILMLALCFTFGYMLQLVNFADIVVALFAGTMPPVLVPIILFFVSVVVSYATGSLGAALVVMLPVGIPLAFATGANAILTFAAVYSGSQWGDQTSPISDVQLENSGANDVDPIVLSKCMMPYRLIDLGVSAVVFFILSLIMC